MTFHSTPPPVLILGCGRSGTSIFGELFQGLGSYEYHSEPDFADMLTAFGPSKAVKVPTESDDYPADAGLSFPLDTLLDKQPSVKIFWIVRHPFDAISSLRIGIGKGWSHHPRPSDWENWLGRSVVEQCAHHWSYINKYGYEAVRHRATVVRFEQLIASPISFAKNICSNINLNTEHHIETLHTWANRVQNTNNKQFVEAVTSRPHSRPDHKVRVDRWRENLNSSEIHIIAKIVEQANAPFNYSLTDDRKRET